jgi:hypothetical protein
MWLYICEGTFRALHERAHAMDVQYVEVPETSTNPSAARHLDRSSRLHSPALHNTRARTQRNISTTHAKQMHFPGTRFRHPRWTLGSPADDAKTYAGAQEKARSTGRLSP